MYRLRNTPNRLVAHRRPFGRHSHLDTSESMFGLFILPNIFLDHHLDQWASRSALKKGTLVTSFLHRDTFQKRTFYTSDFDIPLIPKVTSHHVRVLHIDVHLEVSFSKKSDIGVLLTADVGLVTGPNPRCPFWSNGTYIRVLHIKKPLTTSFVENQIQCSFDPADLQVGKQTIRQLLFATFFSTRKRKGQVYIKLA